MFLLLAELAAKPSVTDEVERVLRSLVDIARDEPGNVIYAVHRHQNSSDCFVLYELYEDRDACDEHVASEPVQRALKRLEPLLVSPPRIVFCSTVLTSGIG